MNYYSHHIGDFDRATRHLTRIERSIYLDLIFVYYDTEQPLTLDKKALCRKIIARTNEEATAVEQVLNEFFTETPNGWFHARCEQELDVFRNSNSQKSLAGKASAAKRAAAKQQALNGNPTVVEQALGERSTDGQLTNIQHPISNSHKPVKVKTTAEPTGPASSGKSEASEVFAYWQQKRGHDKAKLDAKRLKAIKARLKDGYTVGDLCRAVDGIEKSPHHMGENEQRTVYDDIELICRNAVNVDKFAKLATQQSSGINPGLQRQIDVLQEWMAQP